MHEFKVMIRSLLVSIGSLFPSDTCAQETPATVIVSHYTPEQEQFFENLIRSLEHEDYLELKRLLLVAAIKERTRGEGEPDERLKTLRALVRRREVQRACVLKQQREQLLFDGILFLIFGTGRYFAWLSLRDLPWYFRLPIMKTNVDLGNMLSSSALAGKLAYIAWRYALAHR